MVFRSWQLHTQQFLLPKSCSDPAECEDAIGINSEALRFAVADGATEAFDAGNWARRLARCWVADETPALSVEEFRTWVAGQGQRLHSSWQGRHLSWYAEEKSRHGSFAAFVGVQFELNRDRPCWRAIALGDACLVHRRRDFLCSVMPVSEHQNFNSAPVLVPSLDSLQEAALARAVTSSGTFEESDVLLLLSDAAAAWYLRRSETEDPVCAEFDSFLAAAQNKELTRLFQQERRAGRLKDDDIAILRIAAQLERLT